MDLYGREGALHAGDVVYVFYRNPHTQDVANIQEAAVVNHPEQPGQLAVFLYETYYPLTEEMAVYRTADEAEQAYRQVYGDFYGDASTDGAFE